MKNKQIKLLLVGDANSIFFHDYVKALKDYIDVVVDVFAIMPKNNNYNDNLYDNLFFDRYLDTWLYHSGHLAALCNPFIMRNRFSRFLKHNNKKYDIIHFHLMQPAWVINVDEYRKYGKKLICTFWGGEINYCKILFSNKLYIYKLGQFLGNVDFIVNTLSNKKYMELFPEIKDKCRFGIFGSSIIEEIASTLITKKIAKTKLGIPEDSITIMSGYSGKSIHRHIEVISGICQNDKYNNYSSRIFFILPLTRGGNTAYTQEIEKTLQKYDAHSIVLKDRYLSNEEVMCLRKATDIMMQVSKYDGLSSSIKESLVAGTIMICGDWFQYSLLKEQGFKYIEVSNLDEACKTVYDIIDDPEKYSSFANNNNDVAKKQYFWSECIKSWADCYLEALK